MRVLSFVVFPKEIIDGLDSLKLELLIMEIRYRVYGEETGVLPLRQGVKKTVNSPYNSEPLRTEHTAKKLTV